VLGLSQIDGDAKSAVSEIIHTTKVFNDLGAKGRAAVRAEAEFIFDTVVALGARPHSFLRRQVVARVICPSFGPVNLTVACASVSMRRQSQHACVFG
jgi:hypothetical protein